MTIVLRKKKRSTLSTVCSRYGGSHHWDFGVSADKVAFRRNLQDWSENISGATGWSSSGTQVGSTVTLPASSEVAFRAYKTGAVTPYTAYVASLYIPPAAYWSDPSNSFKLTWYGLNAVRLNFTPDTVNGGAGGWLTLVCPADVIGATTTLDVRLGNLTATTVTCSQALKLQVEIGTVPTTYQKITDGYSEFLAAYPLHHLFQDSTGTIPAYAITHPVGLCLDQPAGSVVWEDVPQNWVKASGDGVVTAVGNTITITGATTTTRVDLSPAHPFVDGHLMAEFTVTWSSATSVRVYIAGGAASPSSGVKASYGMSAKNSTLDRLQIDSGTATFVIHSLKLSRGSHASQSNSLKMPKLSARVNMLLATATLSTQSVTTLAASYKLTFAGSGTVTLSGTYSGSLVGGGSLTFTATAGTLTLTVTGSVTVADLRPANSPTNIPAYQRVTSATDYDTVGFPVRAVWDGVDDCLVVPTLDLSLTDKVTVVAGVTKVGTASWAAMLEFTGNADINAGAFSFYAPGGAADTFYASASGSTGNATKSQSGFASPVSAVLINKATLSAATTSAANALSINGSVSGESGGGAVPGGGNFASAGLYIGQRNASSFPFSGSIQSITIIPALTTDAETLVIENAVNTAMGKVY